MSLGESLKWLNVLSRRMWCLYMSELLIALIPKVHLKNNPIYLRGNPEILHILMFGDTKRHPRDTLDTPQEYPQVEKTPLRYPRDISETL